MPTEPSVSATAPGPSGAGPEEGRGGGGRGAAWTTALLWLIVGVAAGLAAAWVMGGYLDYFAVPPLPEELAKRVIPFAPVPEDIVPEIIAAERHAALRNTALGLGI